MKQPQMSFQAAGSGPVALDAAPRVQTPAGRRIHVRTILLIVYLILAMLPIYWMLNMSFKTNEEITGSFSLIPQAFTLANYRTIFTDPSWYSGYINSLI